MSTMIHQGNAESNNAWFCITCAVIKQAYERLLCVKKRVGSAHVKAAYSVTRRLKHNSLYSVDRSTLAAVMGTLLQISVLKYELKHNSMHTVSTIPQQIAVYLNARLQAHQHMHSATHIVQ